ncbi:hypothetical protein FA15DRAFT_592564, partial [Coprinopsis marcescibilis]
IKLFLHPPLSPDVNPIEPLLNDFKAIICTLPRQPTTVPQLISAVKSAWESIDVETINKHTNTMSNHVTAIIAAEGSHTKY